MKKNISLTFAFFLLLLLIIISCNKGNNVSVQKNSVPEKTTNYFPHFVPIRPLTYADVFILDDAIGSEDIKEQRLNGSVRFLSRVVTKTDKGVYKYILMEILPLKLNQHSKFSTVISKKLIESSIDLFKLNIDNKYNFYDGNYNKSKGKEAEGTLMARSSPNNSSNSELINPAGTYVLAMKMPYCTDWFWYGGGVFTEYFTTTCSYCGINATQDPPVPNHGTGTIAGKEGASGNLNTLCGTYKWTTISGAYYAQVNGLAAVFINASGASFTISYGIGCVQISKSSAPTQVLANDAFNSAWATAMEQNTYDVNHEGVLGDFEITRRTTKYIQQYLQTHYPGSTFNKDGCQGNIPATLAKYCHLN